MNKSDSARPPAQTVDEIQLAGVSGSLAFGKSKSKTGLQVANSFITRSGGDSHMSCLVGPRFDLALYLVLLLLAKAPDSEGAHTVRIPTRKLAPLMGHSEYDQRVARAIRDSLNRLTELAAIGQTRPGGPANPPQIRLLDWNTKHPGNYIRPSSGYITLPRAFWVNGWHAALTSRGLAMLLVSLHQDALNNPPGSRPPVFQKPFWISPGAADDWYGMHPDTRGRGWRELVFQELLDKQHQLLDDTLTAHRVRNTYLLIRPRLEAAPTPTA